MTRRDKILITGASSGLGMGMARKFAAAGRDLALCARRLDRLESLRRELGSSYNIRVAVRALDVNDHPRVFTAFEELREELGGIDRAIVNAGINRGGPVGTGRFELNRQTVETNFVAALAQIEAAMEMFRAQGNGHLVIVSSLGAVRGMPGNLTAYNASKAALASLGDGIRADVHDTPIKVTTLLPGYIESELNDELGLARPYVTKADAGSRALFRAVESETAKAFVPRLPWALISLMIRAMPIGRLKKLQ